jgi:hypothetical protein
MHERDDPHVRMSRTNADAKGRDAACRSASAQQS